MKRSEMIKEIQYYIDECEGYVDGEIILDITEEFGMEPPVASIKLDPTYHQDPGEICYIEDNQWEDENE